MNAQPESLGREGAAAAAIADFLLEQARHFSTDSPLRGAALRSASRWRGAAGFDDIPQPRGERGMLRVVK